MATATFIHDGRSVDYTPGSDVAAGDVVVQDALVGIATRGIAAGTLGSLAVSGVFDLPKKTGASEGIAAGAKVYWKAADSQVTVTATNNTYLGKVVKAAADGDATVRVRLEQ